MSKNIFFDEFVDPFQKGPFIIRAEHYMRYVFAAEYLSRKLHKNAVVYDIGCGNAYGVKILTDRNNGFMLIGFDRSEVLLEDAAKREILESSWILTDFENDDMSTIVKKNKLSSPNAVTAFEILEHLEHPEKLLKQLYSLLPDKGILILSVPNERYEPKKNGKPKNKYHKQLFNEESITILVENAGFRVTSIYGQPYTNRLYHTSRKLIAVFDYMADFSSFFFKAAANLIGAVKPGTTNHSYSMLLVAEK
jgi:2-polyprenyl-3-methyl-5-hydroxy-6-metoxy-1,4-benzoquinol methylase